MSEQQQPATGRPTFKSSAEAASDHGTGEDSRALVSVIRMLWARVWLVFLTGTALGSIVWWAIWLGPDQTPRDMLKAATPAALAVATGSLAAVLSLVLALFGRTRQFATDDLPTDTSQLRTELAQLGVLHTLAAVLGVISVAAAAASVNFAFCVGRGRLSTITAYGIAWLGCVLAVLTADDGGIRRDRLRGLVGDYWRERTALSRSAWGACRSPSTGLGELAFCWLTATLLIVALVRPVRENLSHAWKVLPWTGSWVLSLYAVLALMGFAASIGRSLFGFLLAGSVFISFSLLVAVASAAQGSATWPDVWAAVGVLATCVVIPLARAVRALRHANPSTPRPSAVVSATYWLIAAPRGIKRPARRRARLATVVRRYRELAGIDPILLSEEDNNG